MATADVINMNEIPGQDLPNMVEHGLRPKGHAIAGIDYGLDLIPEEGADTDKKKSSQDQSQKTQNDQHSQNSQSQAQYDRSSQHDQYDQPSQSQSQGWGKSQSQSQGQGWGKSQSQSQSQGQGWGKGHQVPQNQFGVPESVGFDGSSYDMQPQHPMTMYSTEQKMGYGDHVGMPGFAPTPMDGQSMGGSSQGIPRHSGFVDSNLLGQMSGTNGSGYQEELSYEQKRQRKTDALASLARLESQGYVPAGKKGSHTTELSELEAMVDKLTAQRNLDNSIKDQRKMLIGFATLVESVCENDDYNIFELNLEGWSESVYENISDYDEIFEELYLKYKDVTKIPPELKLVTMVAGSAWMFHMSRNMFGKAASKVPGFDDVMKFDPKLKKHYQQTATSLAQQRGVPVPDRKKDKNNMNFLGQVLGMNQTPDMEPPPQMQQRQGQASPRQPNHQPPHRSGRRSAPPPQQPPRKTRTRVPMEEPQDVDGLLSGLVTHSQNQAHNGSYMPEEDEIDLSELENMSDLDQL